MNEFQLPKDFLMGSTATAVLIEGGNRNTDWYRWCETPGHIKDGSHVIRGTDHWNRYAEDIQIMNVLNHDTYCTSVEWSRIEPEEGKFDPEAVKRYRDEISLLRQKGIEPLISLYHLSLPLWFADMGGWENPRAAVLFLRYARFVVSELGDLVNDWITVFDPNLSLAGGYLWGGWPPGKKDTQAMFEAMRHMISAHINCYREIHKIVAEKGRLERTRVGFAVHIRLFDPDGDKLINKMLAGLDQHMVSDMMLSGMATGKLGFPLGLGGYPAGKGKFCDFIGINYYTRNIVRFKNDPKQMFSEIVVMEDAEKSEGGEEIYPEGLYRVCKKYYEKYKTPIFITGNGVFDSVDNKRPKFIYGHLCQVAKLIKEGIPVERYYHWTLVDLFETFLGESGRLGLVHNDFATQKRTIRESGRFYGEICKQKGVTQELIDKYLNV